MTYPTHHREHSINARKGVRTKHLKRSKGIKLPDKDILKRDIKSGEITRTLNDADRSSRSPESINQDFSKRADKTLSPNKLKNINAWSKDPAHIDLKGVDTQEEAYDFDQGRGYSGRQSATQEVRKALGDNSDVYDLEAEIDSELSNKENAESVRVKINPRFRDVNV
ncbi:MAG: hypothetical protein WC364_14115 [Eubacteriales bacterium]|jgi:hypothetical protein